VSLIAYFIGNISAKKNQIPFTRVKVIASQRWDVSVDVSDNIYNVKNGLQPFFMVSGKFGPLTD